MAPSASNATNLALARLQAGKSLLRDERGEEAEPLLREAFAQIPSVPDHCNQEGLDLRKRGELAEAILNFRVALLLKPDMAIAHLNLALAYRDSGRRDLALQHARRAAALRPTDTRAQDLVRQLEQM